MSSQFNYSLTVFSPSGKLVQIEHALAAVANGRSTVGIMVEEGVILIAENQAPSILFDESTLSKIEKICPNIAITYSGLGPDFRILVAQARKIAAKYKLQFGEYPTTYIMASEVSKIMQEYTQQSGVRPFGISVLLAGFDDNHSYLFQCDPSGAFFPWKATALGKNGNNSKMFLSKRYHNELNIEDAVHVALFTLKESLEGKLNEDSVQIVTVDSDGYREWDRSTIKDFIEAANR